MNDNNSLINIHSFIDYWMQQLGSNDQYSDLPADDIHRIQTNSKDFLNMLIQSTPSLANIDSDAIKPLLEFLRMVRKQHEQQGLSIRDTTLLTLSLKSSLTEYLKENNADKELFERLNQILDTFGILSFELYTNEQEQIVGKQAEQIKFLQNLKQKPLAN